MRLLTQERLDHIRKEIDDGVDLTHSPFVHRTISQMLDHIEELAGMIAERDLSIQRLIEDEPHDHR